MKEKSRFDALGDRMKAYEALETSRVLMPGLPTMVRLDGRSFHTFTKGMPRPYHLPMSLSMIETARYLVYQTPAAFAYTQSDEITLGFWQDDTLTEPLFGGRIQKLTSVLAGMATAKFNQEVAARMPEKSARLPVFDARVFNMPSLKEMANCVLFRALDCEKNAITMAASAYYSHKELTGKNSSDKHEMLFQKGVNWAKYPSFFKNGTFLKRQAVMRELSNEELARIPANRRPTGPIARTQVLEMDWPPFKSITNPVGVLFHGEEPVLKSAQAQPEPTP